MESEYQAESLVPPQKNSSSFWKKAFFTLLLGIVICAVAVGSYYLGTLKNTVGNPSPINNVSPTISKLPGKTITSGANAYSFLPYHITVPADWRIEQRGQSYLVLSKNGYTINIAQGPLDFGECSYVDNKISGNFTQEYPTFVAFSDQDNTVYRRGQADSDGLIGLRFDVCTIRPGEAHFSQNTLYGVITYDTPSKNAADETILKQMDSILATLKSF